MNKIGDILRASTSYSTKLEEKKHCWRIEYSDEAQFHMDISPAIPESSTTSSILVTDKHDDKYNPDIKVSPSFHFTSGKTSKLSTQPKNVDIFPRTCKGCKTALKYFLQRIYAKLQSGHQNDQLVAR